MTLKREFAVFLCLAAILGARSLQAQIAGAMLRGSAATKKPDLKEFRVTVNSYDWGGWTKLRVTAELEGNGGAVVAHVQGHPGQESLAIPKDDNSNHIADWWEHWFELKNADASADDDGAPLGDGHAGDSIALYDEYRGFHIQGHHERLSPLIKDLFVFDENRLGTGIYQTVTGVNTWVVNAAEKADIGKAVNPHIVTPNGSHGEVYCLWLRNHKLGGGGVGDTDGLIFFLAVEDLFDAGVVQVMELMEGDGLAARGGAELDGEADHAEGDVALPDGVLEYPRRRPHCRQHETGETARPGGIPGLPGGRNRFPAPGLRRGPGSDGGEKHPGVEENRRGRGTVERRGQGLTVSRTER